jgi:glycosyltransferase involved in cell wall biosynthesis
MIGPGVEPRTPVRGTHVPSRDTSRGPAPSVAILLSAHNGERFLQEQLDSLVRQTHPAWVLFWRDDGSSDAALAILQRFETLAGKGRSRFVARSGALGAPGSYMALLASAWHEQFKYFAFADQDDVWFEDKIARGLAALSDVPPDLPALYCARQELVDEQLRHLGKSPALRREPGFPTALTQNIATGCTVLLNRAAVEVVLSIRAPENTLHDWWSYITVSAAGGRIISDDRTVLQYRQHDGNLVGSPLGTLRRGVAALRRGPGPFMALFRRHVTALLAHSDLLTDSARADLVIIARALAGGPIAKLRALSLPGLRRQTWLENLVFRIWFLLG